MGDTWITDLRHFGEPAGRGASMPGPARRLANYLGAIVESLSIGPWGVPHQTPVLCRRRPGHRPCGTPISGLVGVYSRRIRWACPRCGENGLIQGWEGTRWDRSARFPAGAPAAPGGPPEVHQVTYRAGMLADLREREGLRETVFQGEALSPAVVAAVHANELWDLAGEYGHPEAGDPIQYDELRVEHAGGSTHVTIYNRAIMLFRTEDELVKRIHRVCCAIEVARTPPHPPAGPASART